MTPFSDSMPVPGDLVVVRSATASVTAWMEHPSSSTPVRTVFVGKRSLGLLITHQLHMAYVVFSKGCLACWVPSGYLVRVKRVKE